MAKSEATLILKVKNLGGAALKGFNNGMKSIVFTAGDVVRGIKAMVTAGIEFAQLGAQARSVQTAFTNLASSQGQDAKLMLDKMRELSQGTISDMELMKQANNALLLGLPVDRFGDMLTIARSSAKGTGQSMQFMLNSIVTGLGRGSKLMLDNLGIIIKTEDAYKKFADAAGTTASKLDDAQKKQAFINEALRIGTSNANKMGASTLSLVDRMQRLTAQFENVRVALSQNVGPAFNVLISTVETFFSKFNNFAKSSGGQKFFVDTALFVSDLVSGIGLLITNLGVGLGGAFAAANAALHLEFGRAKEIAKLTIEEIALANQEADAASKARAEQAAVDLQALDERKLDQFKTNIANKALVAEEARAEEKLKEDEFFALKNEEEILREATQQAILKDQKLKNKVLELNGMIKREKDFNKKMALMKQKREIIEQKSEAIRTEQMTKMAKFKEWVNSQEVRGKMQTLSRIASLTSANNKVLAALGKAAASANIIMDTASGAMKAYAQWGFPFGAIMASGVIAAGAVQLGKVNGVQLAEGGIVTARQGGIQATIGEGGRDEAVIPLPKGFKPENGGLGGTNISITVNGGFLGDESSARELALAIDGELLKLRQSNESEAFDEGII